MQELGQLAARYEAGDPWGDQLGGWRRSRDHRSFTTGLGAKESSLESSQSFRQRGRGSRRVAAQATGAPIEHEAGNPCSTRRRDAAEFSAPSPPPPRYEAAMRVLRS